MRNNLIRVLVASALGFAAIGGTLALLGGAAHAVDVMAPYWAYQLQVGMRLEELRTHSGVIYRNVRIQAMTTVEMQFSHSRGVSVELMTNIIDPNQYLKPATVVPGAGSNVHGAAPPAGGNAVGRNGPLAEAMPAAVRVASGVEKLTPAEQRAVMRWAESDGSRNTQGLGLEKLTRTEQQHLINWLSAQITSQQSDQAGTSSGRQNPPDAFTAGGGQLPQGSVRSQIHHFFGFEPGRTFQLQDGTKWQQLDEVHVGVNALTSPKVVIYPWRDSWVMQVEGQEQRVHVKPVRPGL